MFEMRLHPLYEMDGEIGAASESVEVTTDVVDPGSAEEVAPQAETESSFARRLREHSEKEVRAAREAWDKETSEKYKDYDTHKELSTYLQQVNGVDAMTLKERIEMDRLQERAEQNEIPPEMQKRLETLEAKAAKADELEQQQHQEKWENTYWTGIGEFAKERGVESQALNQFMLDNGLFIDPENLEKSFNIAYKAMKADELEQKLNTAKEDSIKEYLASKKGPRVEGSTGAVGLQSVDTSKMSWKDVEKHAAARLEASRTPQ